MNRYEMRKLFEKVAVNDWATYDIPKIGQGLVAMLDIIEELESRVSDLEDE